MSGNINQPTSDRRSRRHHGHTDFWGQASRNDCGFGIGGDEKVGALKDFGWSFDCAREAGLRITAHAGEWNGPDEVRGAVRDVGVERVGHGVRAIEDLALVDELTVAVSIFLH